jgi:hypothetical protein
VKTSQQRSSRLEILSAVTAAVPFMREHCTGCRVPIARILNGRSGTFVANAPCESPSFSLLRHSMFHCRKEEHTYSSKYYQRAKFGKTFFYLGQIIVES